MVVDPHSDLVNDIMEGMPVGAAGAVRLIDLGDPTRACGINLLDVTTFPERGLAVSMILAVARSSSLNWGDRMEEILRWTLYALYEANANRNPEEQYTIYDCVDFLTDESRRKEIIQEGRKGDVAQWWYKVSPVDRAEQRPRGSRPGGSQNRAVRGHQGGLEGTWATTFHPGHYRHHTIRQGTARQLGPRTGRAPRCPR